MMKTWLNLAGTVAGAVGAHVLYLAAGGLAPLIIECLLWANAVSGASVLFFTLNGAEVSRRLGAPRLFAGQNTEVKLEVTQRSLLPVCWMVVREHWVHEGREESSCKSLLCFPWTASTVSLSYSLEDVGRGQYVLERTELLCGDLFGLFAKRRVVKNEAAFTVYPAPESFGLRGVPGTESESRGKPSRHLRTTDVSAGIRAYAEGDPMSWIDWKATARTGSLQTQVRSGMVKPSRIIVLDTEPGCGGADTGCECVHSAGKGAKGGKSASSAKKGKNGRKGWNGTSRESDRSGESGQGEKLGSLTGTSVPNSADRNYPARTDGHPQADRRLAFGKSKHIRGKHSASGPCGLGQAMLEKRIRLAAYAVLEPDAGTGGIVTGTSFRERAVLAQSAQPYSFPGFQGVSSFNPDNGASAPVASAPLELLAAVRGETGKGIHMLRKEHASRGPGVTLLYLTSSLDEALIVCAMELLAARRPLQIVYVSQSHMLTSQEQKRLSVLREAGVEAACFAATEDRAAEASAAGYGQSAKNSGSAVNKRTFFMKKHKAKRMKVPASADNSAGIQEMERAGSNAYPGAVSRPSGSDDFFNEHSSVPHRIAGDQEKPKEGGAEDAIG
ncbi:DUF58 domain-containing protein [Paenibacillus chitinolyticus]|uniref:DUF58 domain-containing protein n=1 Tax=Paenibacillus chitinolyticus TaxID=79263 RepID=UPI001C438861|nr:DUF58 domain-containing protein [Paenibacillus chitinolyticus]MBV6717148.1 DUF58 domain-containing protein [Paenibacillus chitinolyticus]